MLEIHVPFGSSEHIIPILAAFVIGFLLIYLAKNKLGNNHKILLFNILGFLVSFTVITYHTYLMLTTEYDISKDLPLFLCSFMALLIPIFTYFRKYWMYEILIFWILAGTTQGIITPDISQPFPEFEYFRYWVVHLGLVIIILYATIIFKFRPVFKSVFKSLIALQLYVFVIFLINWVLNSNYSYLMRKPNVASALDYLGEWPMYIIFAELMAIPYFLLIYLPFYFINKKSIASI